MRWNLPGRAGQRTSRKTLRRSRSSTNRLCGARPGAAGRPSAYAEAVLEIRGDGECLASVEIANSEQGTNLSACAAPPTSSGEFPRWGGRLCESALRRAGERAALVAVLPGGVSRWRRSVSGGGDGGRRPCADGDQRRVIACGRASLAGAGHRERREAGAGIVEKAIGSADVKSGHRLFACAIPGGEPQHRRGAGGAGAARRRRAGLADGRRLPDGCHRPG